MRISDWSSDVCSSDLQSGHQAAGKRIAAQPNLHRHALDDAHEIAGRIVGGDQAKGRTAARREAVDKSVQRHVGIAVDAAAYRLAGADMLELRLQIGRASCRERVCQYV